MKKRDENPKVPPGTPANAVFSTASQTPGADHPSTPGTPSKKRGRPLGSTKEEKPPCAICTKAASACKCRGGPYLTKPTVEVSESLFRYLMMAVTQFSAGAVALTQGIPYLEAVKIWNFQANEIHDLYGPGKKVVEKWAPIWLVLFADEISLAIVLMPILGAKMAATAQLKQQLAEAKALADEEHAPENPPAKPNGSAGTETLQ